MKYNIKNIIWHMNRRSNRKLFCFKERLGPGKPSNLARTSVLLFAHRYGGLALKKHPLRSGHEKIPVSQADAGGRW